MLERDGDDPTLLLESAELYAIQSESDLMRQTLQRYLKVQRRSDQALQAAARLYRRERMYEEAEELFKALIKSSPAQLSYANELAELYRDWGKVELLPKSYSTYLKARDRQPSDLIAIAQRLRQYGYQDQAIPYLEEAAEEGEPSAWLLLADIYVTERRDAEMKRALQRYMETSQGTRRDVLDQVLPRYKQANLIPESDRGLKGAHRDRAGRLPLGLPHQAQ